MPPPTLWISICHIADHGTCKKGLPSFLTKDGPLIAQNWQQNLGGEDWFNVKCVTVTVRFLD